MNSDPVQKEVAVKSFFPAKTKVELTESAGAATAAGLGRLRTPGRSGSSTSALWGCVSGSPRVQSPGASVSADGPQSRRTVESPFHSTGEERRGRRLRPEPGLEGAGPAGGEGKAAGWTEQVAPAGRPESPPPHTHSSTFSTLLQIYCRSESPAL